MIRICPTIDAFSTEDYRKQIEQVQSFADTIHIDLMDGDFAPVASPALEDVWWPYHIQADIHLMYRTPMDYVQQLIALKPHMVIVHAEASVHHMHFAAELHKHGIKAGLALLQETPVDNVTQIMHSFDQVLIFSGHLGYQGGVIDLGLLEKVYQVREYYRDIEIAWDGGVNDENIQTVVDGGVTVLNVGGFIQKSVDPQSAYDTLKTIVTNP